MTAEDVVESGARRGAARSRRPDRRAMILREAAAAFTANGYHATRLDDIAERVGISGPALYRHFPTKYALFADTTAHLSTVLAAAIDSVSTDLPAERELPELLSTLTRVALDHRHTGGLYRWERRFLLDDDSDAVRRVLVDQHRRVRTALDRYRHGQPRTDLDTLAAAMIAVIASPTTHATTLAPRQAKSLLADAALALADIPLTAGTDEPRAPSGLPPATKREVLLAESIRLFAERGFGEVSVETITRAAGLPTSGFYRHFDSKAAILQVAFWRASDRVTAAIAESLDESSTPAEAITAMVTRYVRLCHLSPDLITVYVAEGGNLAPDERTALRYQQRMNVDEWAAWVTRARPDITTPRARFLVQAALNVVHDLSQGTHRPPADTTTALACRILLGD